MPISKKILGRFTAFAQAVESGQCSGLSQTDFDKLRETNIDPDYSEGENARKIKKQNDNLCIVVNNYDHLKKLTSEIKHLCEQKKNILARVRELGQSNADIMIAKHLNSDKNKIDMKLQALIQEANAIHQNNRSHVPLHSQNKRFISDEYENRYQQESKLIYEKYNTLRKINLLMWLCVILLSLVLLFTALIMWIIGPTVPIMLSFLPELFIKSLIVDAVYSLTNVLLLGLMGLFSNRSVQKLETKIDQKIGLNFQDSINQMIFENDNLLKEINEVLVANGEPSQKWCEASSPHAYTSGQLSQTFFGSPCFGATVSSLERIEPITSYVGDSGHVENDEQPGGITRLCRK